MIYIIVLKSFHIVNLQYNNINKDLKVESVVGKYLYVN